MEPWIEDGVNPSNSSAVVIVWSIGLDLPIQTERAQGTHRVEKYNANSGYSGAYMSRPDVRRTVYYEPNDTLNSYLQSIGDI